MYKTKDEINEHCLPFCLTLHLMRKLRGFIHGWHQVHAHVSTSPYMIHVIIPIIWTKSQMHLKLGY